MRFAQNGVVLGILGFRFFFFFFLKKKKEIKKKKKKKKKKREIAGWLAEPPLAQKWGGPATKGPLGKNGAVGVPPFLGKGWLQPPRDFPLFFFFFF
jgi:hypothetical protein